MKIIDLLNKIANREEVPKYVQYYNMLKDKTDIMMVCKENIFYKLDQLEIQINSRIEPVEEEKKIPEELKLYTLSDNDSADFTTLQDFNNRDIQRTINWILDYLKSKGDE